MRTFIHRSGLYAALLVMGISGDSLADQGDDSAFFQQRSQLAYNAVFGLPVVAPRLAQNLEWQISVEHGNQFVGGEADDERLVLDGESTRLAIRQRWRFGPCSQFEATIPFVSHHNGEFDYAIDQWHKLFMLPDANRDKTAFDRLLYAYTDEDGVKHDIRAGQSGIGDVKLSIQRALNCGQASDASGAASMIRAGIKLPTGDPEELRGSGKADFFADWQSPVWSAHERWRLGAALGVLLTSNTDRFAEQKNLAAYGSVGAQFVLHQRLRLIAQLDGHSAFYRSELRELGDPSINLVLGARYIPSRSYTVELSISEDAAIDTTPDIAARLALTYRP